MERSCLKPFPRGQWSRWNGLSGINNPALFGFYWISRWLRNHAKRFMMQWIRGLERIDRRSKISCNLYNSNWTCPINQIVVIVKFWTFNKSISVLLFLICMFGTKDATMSGESDFLNFSSFTIHTLAVYMHTS
jgi:hypothetical protein